ENQRPHVAAPCLLEQIDGGDHRAARGQHGIDDQCEALVELTDQAFEIGLRLECFLIARDAHSAHLGTRYEAEYAIEHADARPQYGHHGHLLACQLLDVDRATPALDSLG